MASKKQTKARDSASVVRTTRSTRSADRSPYARRVTRSSGKATAAVEPDNGNGQSQPPFRRRSKRNEGPASPTSSRPTNSSQPETIALRATESNSTLSQTLVAEGTQASTSNDNDTVHSRAATPKSEVQDSDEDEGEDFVQYFIAPVDPFPSPPPDEYSPTPERDWQPFDPVKSPTPPLPGSRAQIESAVPDAQRVATPDDDSPPRSTPPLYYPAWPPSPTLLDRHPQTWLDEVLVSIERQRGNLVSELRDAEVDVKDALAESFKALVAVKELVGPQGLDGLEKALDLPRGGRRKGDRRGGDPEIVGLMRMVQAMVGPEMVKKMLTDARDTAAGDDFEEDAQAGEGVVDVDGEHGAANQR
ncbi:hypothetical protein PC9H_008148 [Pleurotus ostreatus]|uniref:Uncharacterized protein n=1 Tax=Pleurotus ostreatus TaxID=5322 RepID=A0A8H7DS73_PLEOS|nr:uncharacterized protein PC9H_008148 [Pleurotus ostreatus]KAF7428912.1 hypothetical protein PC9H_008148 [Pleurotus ostreatus]KAJ8697171.1 hypothetical protein PTI98_006970 [Pleurotus ostreatus]